MVKKLLILALLAFAIFTSACVYIVLPEGLETLEAAGGGENMVWNALVTNIEQTEAGALHIDITIRNDTGDWSTMQAAAAVLKTSDGKTTNCGQVMIGSGGHRLAPGFQMRGYTTGKGPELKTQLLYVECTPASGVLGASLSIPYVSYNGILDDYAPEGSKKVGTLVLDLDRVETNVSYPIASPVDGLVHAVGTSFTGLSDNVVTLMDVARTETGFQFTWQNQNPTKFALKTHIGTPPVIGADGIIYGVYEILDFAPVPITPANESMQWTTAVAAPQDVAGYYILLSVESKKPRTYINYAIDIRDQ